LVRKWREDGRIADTPPDPGAAGVAARCNALVLSQHEHASCAGLIDAARAAGAAVAITAGAGPVTLLTHGRDAEKLPVPALHEPVDDIGAGDVFAAAFFVAVSEGRPAPDAARFASAAAAVRLDGSGTGADAIGGRGAVEARLHATAGARG
jgi:ribokinase